MKDHYSVLGLEKHATTLEIKTAFRKLAKIYHPDKNPNDPNAKNKFEIILKAYNTLVNTHSRARYDRLKTDFNATKTSSGHSNKKTWTFTEEDLKQRQYYKNHYQTRKNKTVVVASDYSDYKYIMFATPLAVGLFMVIISMFSTNDTQPKNKTKIKNDSIINTNSTF